MGIGYTKLADEYMIPKTISIERFNVTITCSNLPNDIQLKINKGLINDEIIHQLKRKEITRFVYEPESKIIFMFKNRDKWHIIHQPDKRSKGYFFVRKSSIPELKMI